MKDAVAHLLLKERPDPPVRLPDLDETPDSRTGGPRIRGPRCAWEPERHHLWMCTSAHC